MWGYLSSIAVMGGEGGEGVNIQKRKKTCKEGEKNGKRLEARKYSDVMVEKL